MNGAEVYRQVLEENLVASSELFERGTLDTAPTEESFVRRLNTISERRRTGWGVEKSRLRIDSKVPATFVDAIENDGTLNYHAEIFALGRWLLLEGCPGMKSSPGKKADPKVVLQQVAVVMAELRARSLQERWNSTVKGRKSRHREITKHDLVDRWEKLFGAKLKPSTFVSRLRSVERFLPHYLKYLNSGAAIYAGKEIRKSPEIENVLDAITGMLPKVRKTRPAIFTEPDVLRPARLASFDIPLEYQSDAHAEEHRRLPPGINPEPRLRYVPTKTSPLSSSGKLRADRERAITLVPEVAIRCDYKIQALIDRLAILVETRKVTTWKRLQNTIEKQTGISLWVHDRRSSKPPKGAWGAPLPKVDPAELTGTPFAIMIQEPTPGVPAAILNAIKGGPGIIEPVLLHLIEVSVDFYPRKPCMPEEAILRRERMVGLLQRHHWTRPSRILKPDSMTPRYADARQLSEKEIAYGEVVPKTSFLFTHMKSSGGFYRNESDALVSDPEIRNRILTKKPGSKLRLNSTLAKGGKFSPHMVSVQNKIADRRNLGKKTFISLPDEERRARMEVTISGTETLKKYALRTIDDLGSISFRKLTRDFLRCRLPIIEPVQHIFEDAQVQMRSRGVYGLNLRLRALAEERRQTLKQAGKKPPRKTKDEELGLADWKEMNAVTGDALDGLKLRWSGFTAR